MKRTAYKQLLTWKEKRNRKPLIIQGARQVGKTFLVNEFGSEEFDDFIYLNFEEDPNLASLFSSSLSPDVIINNISLYIGRKVISENTLIFFDEVQLVPGVITSLKYFQEKAPEYHVIAAGSLLGIILGKKTSFPVGKVNFLTLNPLSFSEYLMAIGEELLLGTLKNHVLSDSLIEALHFKLLDHLKTYLFLGGMPEVIQDYIVNRDIVSVRLIQNDILSAYTRDFSKYTEKDQSIKLSEFWNSLPGQLAKENKKFKYSEIRKGARSSTYEQSIEWLRKAGLINVVNNISSPKLPLSAYADFSKFKVYMHDVGLLAAQMQISSDLIVDPGRIFSEFNGAFIENFIAQELKYHGWDHLYYWTSRSDAEVDFILMVADQIVPVEVKSGLSRNLKSLRSYADKYRPTKIVRMSPRNFVRSGDFVNLPLYASDALHRVYNL